MPAPTWLLLLEGFFILGLFFFAFARLLGRADQSRWDFFFWNDYKWGWSGPWTRIGLLSMWGLLWPALVVIGAVDRIRNRRKEAA